MTDSCPPAKVRLEISFKDAEVSFRSASETSLAEFRLAVLPNAVLCSQNKFPEERVTGVTAKGEPQMLTVFNDETEAACGARADISGCRL